MWKQIKMEMQTWKQMFIQQVRVIDGSRRTLCQELATSKLNVARQLRTSFAVVPFSVLCFSGDLFERLND